MPRPCRTTLACFPLAAILAGTAPVAAADLPFASPVPMAYGGPSGGGGYRVARVAVRPAPLRYDIYGYPLLAGGPSPLVVGGGCPTALQPDYDPDGNLAGYAPILMCR